MHRVFLVGRQVIGRAFLASLLVLLLGSLVWAQSTAVQNGLGWLAGYQDIDGHWPSVEVSDYHVTSEALNTLTLLSPASPTLATGRSWLETQESLPTDFLARRVALDAGTGVDAAARVTELLTLRAPSGVWGGYQASLENTLDTSLALQALESANYPNLTIINPALAYLTSAQNTDGGWGFTKGDASNVYMTAVVSANLQQFPQMTIIATAVGKATSYLLAHQNIDGGFGSSPSTVYETALAFIALVGNGQSGAQQAAPLQNAVNYLTATQAANGSWNDDPYSTALALKALYLSENRPSPPPPPPAGGSITGTAVDATTNQRLAGVAVVLGSDPLINAPTDASGNFTLNDVPPGSQQVNLSLKDYQSATAEASVAVDATVTLGNVGLVSSYSTGAIAGTITDPAGKPLAGVAVAVAGAWSGNATTGADGSFLFTYVTPGAVTITVSKAGYQTATVPGTVYARTTLSFSPRLSTTPPQVATGTLIGRVIDSYWGVPIDHLPEEKGVTVTLSGGITAEPDPDSRGIFELQGLAPDTYQVTVGMNGFATQTFRVVIAPGVTTDLGTIRLVMSVSKMTLTGKVTDAVTGAPIPGAAVSVAGTLLTGRSDSSGTYGIADLEHPAEITVRASATGYTGKSFLVQTSPWTQIMNITLTPLATTGQPTGTEVDVTVQTDKPLYTKNDTVGLTVNLWNKVGRDYATSLHVKVTDPAGADVYDWTQELNLAADATLVQCLDVVLPLSAPGGTYKVVAEALDANGMLLGSGTKTVAVSTSRITVTPTLPEMFVSGDNTVSFKLDNAGTLAVSNGGFAVTLTDPDGEVIATETQAFALGLGESTTLHFTAPIPALKFGTYILAYTQSDETIAGSATELSLPSNLAVTAIYDDNSRRIRSTAGLMVSLNNSGMFNLDLAGAGLPVTVSVPDAGYEETKTLLPVPAVGSASGSALLYQFAIPETVTAGLHPTTVTVTLPSGSALVQTAQLAILESSLSFSPLQKSVTAGETIHPAIANTGGVDTPVQYTLRLLDAKAAEIAQISGTETARAGETLGLSLDVPSGAVDGDYRVIAGFKDMKTGKEQIVPSPITITGVKGSLQVQTDKEEYLATEDITALSSTGNNGTLLQDGNLHLQVVTTAGTRKQKIWTSQEDFQTGVRRGVDTYGVNDWIIPDDDFDGPAIDTSKWIVHGKVSINVSNKVFFDSMVDQASLTSKWRLEGNFDIQVEYESNNSFNSQGPQLYISGDDFRAVVDNDKYLGDNGNINIWSQQQVYRAHSNVFRSSGRLRITRDADTIALYYWDAGQWTLINSATAPQLNTPCQVTLVVWRSTATTGASAVMDNFRVSSGRIRRENQTIDSVRLLPLNDNFDGAALNGDRWEDNRGAMPPKSPGLEHLITSGTPVNGNYTIKSITHRVAFAGDYTAVTAFKNFTCTPKMTDSGSFAFETGAHGDGFNVHRSSRNAGDVVYGMSKINQAHVSGPAVLYPANDGKFRLRRIGRTGISEYWDGTKWFTLNSKVGILSEPVRPYIYVISHIDYPTVQADVDYFYTNQGIYANQGTLTFKYDSGSNASRWGKILYTSTLPAGTSIQFRTRTADTEADLSNALWSDITASGSPITSPAARWIEIEATLATTDTNVTPLLHDLTVAYDSDPGQVLWQTDDPANLAPGAISELNNTIGTMGVTGKLFLQGELTSSTGQTVAFADYPFYVEQGDMAVHLATDKQIYRPGEVVTIDGEVKNLSSVDAAGLVLRVQDPGAEGGTLYTETFDLPANSGHSFIFTTTAGADGIHALRGVVTQNNTTLAEISEQYETASPMVTAALTAPDIVGNDPFTITVSLQNTCKVNVVTGVLLEDGGGEALDSQEVTIPVGETRMLQYTRQIAGDTTFTATFSGDLNQTVTKRVAYAAMRSVTSAGVSAKIVTNKVSYNPNEQVTLISTVTANSPQENLSARITVTDSQGQGVYSATAALPILVQGQTITIDEQWNTGTNPAGAYLVTLQIIDAAGVVSAHSTCDLVISSTTKPNALLKGQISLDKQSIFAGEPITVSYSVTNAGNIDLSNIALSIQTVNLADETLYSTITDQATLVMGAGYSNSRALDTLNYSAKDYFVVLRASINGVEETLAGTYFRVNKDETPPELTVQSPVEGETYRTGVSINAQASDAVSGIDKVEYRLDDKEGWTALALSDGSPDTYAALWETTFEDDGPHTIVVRAVDKAGNQSVSAPLAFEVVIDFTPPETRIETGEPRFQAPDGPVYVTRATTFSLSATDDLSGVQATYCRIDVQATWREYEGSFSLAGLDYGAHAIHFSSLDNAGNEETEKSIEVTLIDMEVESEILNLPRVLVWAGEPAKKAAYTLDDIRALLSEALASPDAYFKLTSDKAEFQNEFRSGLYNMVFILDQDLPFNAPFLREIQEAVGGGMGLLVSSWGNSVHPILQNLFGVDFRGSLAMSEQNRSLRLFESPLASDQTLAVQGRVLRTNLAGGLLAGIIPGESTCSSVHSLTLHYPVEVRSGDRLTATLSAPQGKKLVTVDEEHAIVTTLPGGAVNGSLGNTGGDLAITEMTAEGLTLLLVAPYGELAASYTLTLTIEHADGSRIVAGSTTITPTCDAHLAAGMMAGPFQVTQVEEDRVGVSADLPAVVLGSYGAGRTVFLAYDLVGSALAGDRAGHSVLLRSAANWLLPEDYGARPGGIALLQIRLLPRGGEVDLKAVDTLGEGLQHLPLFGLTRQPLEYVFHLNEGEEGSYRYFLRLPDEAGEYGKTTEVFLGLDGGYAPFGSYPFHFTVETDSQAQTE